MAAVAVLVVVECGPDAVHDGDREGAGIDNEGAWSQNRR